MSHPPQKPTGISPILVIFFISGMLGLLGAIGMLLSESANPTEPTPPAAARIIPPGNVASVIGQPAQDFQLTSITGELVSLAQFRGRPVFINLWWTGCAPCVREFPAFQQFMEEQGQNGAVIIAINQGENLEAVRQFVTDLGTTDVIVLLDPDVQIVRSFPYNVFPTTYFIDSEGIIRAGEFGEITLDALYLYLESIRDDDESVG